MDLGTLVIYNADHIGNPGHMDCVGHTGSKGHAGLAGHMGQTVNLVHAYHAVRTGQQGMGSSRSLVSVQT